jgi:hypothetical protein
MKIQCQWSQHLNKGQEKLMQQRARLLGTELSLSSRERMTLEVEAIFWFISHTLPQCHVLQEVGDTYL